MMVIRFSGRAMWNLWARIDPGRKFGWLIAVIFGSAFTGLYFHEAALASGRASNWADYPKWTLLFDISYVAFGLAVVLPLPTLLYGVWRWRRIGGWRVAVVLLALIVLLELLIAALLLYLNFATIDLRY